MAEIAGVIISAVACVAQCFSPSGGHRINRWRGFKMNFKILKAKVKTLKAERTSIQRTINLAKKNGDGIQENVQNWLERAEEIEEEILKWLERASKIIGDDQEATENKKDEETAAAGEIGGDAEIAAQQQGEVREDIQATAAAATEIEEGEETVAAAGEIREDEEKTVVKNRCVKGLCRNLKSRYQLSKEAETLLEHVKTLLEDVKHLEARKSDKIYYPVVPNDPRLSSKDYLAFESRTSTLNNVISSLSDPHVNIVGIYGMGGIGKTTLAKKVANQLKASKLFDSVIFVEVTEKPDITKIQKEIAEKFPGLTFSQEETQPSRAARLYQRLENEKNILLILDNIWAKINLEEIGISLGDGRKLLLTARSVDVLLPKMESQRNFPVELLDDEEAWQLFKEMSRDNIEGREFKSVAREVAKKCAHLPIVIVTVARALSGKKLFEWRNASRQMGLSSPADIQHIHASIELSFNYLETEKLKKTILLIGYASITSIDQLLMYGMGMALFEDVNKMEGRRDRVLTLVEKLKHSCLLLDSNARGEDFSMHDVVREVAMSVACRDSQVLTKLQSLDHNALKVCHSIVLKDVDTGELPQVLECQQLNLLSISQISFSSPLHDEFFERVTELKVLVLDRLDFLSLPSSLRFLTNLRALRLYKCWLHDMANIGDLKELEILSFNKSLISKLPEEVGQLTRLKSLDLRGCSPLAVIAPYVLSSLSHLEELYMGDFSGWEEEGLNKDRKNVSLDELKHLYNLTCLEIKIKDAKTLPRDLPHFSKLERYEIKIGESTRMLDEDWILKSCRKLNLSLINTNICLNDGHIMQLKKIEVLCLNGSQDMKNVLYGLGRDGFQHLKYLHVSDNYNLLCIVEGMMYASNDAFPVLEALLIRNLINLEKICHDQLTTESSFSQLRKIDVRYCTKLRNIFSLSFARRLQLLQSIDVGNCENMKEIFAIEREDESSCNISEVIDSIKLSQLRSLRLCSLPQLKSLEYNSNCYSMLFSEKVLLPSLEVLNLDHINVERICQNPVAAMSCGIQNLTKLTIRKCNNLKCLFSSSTIENFDRLQYLEISSCRALEEIMVIDDEDGLRKEERKNNVEFSIFSINNYLKMTVERCPKLKTLFPRKMYKKFLRLKSLSVSDCDLLEVIFDFEDPDFKDKHSSVVITQLWQLEIVSLPKLKQVWNKDPKRFVSFENLKEVSIVGCDVLKYVFPASVARSLSQLESLDISFCCGVEEIVFAVEEEAETNSKFVFPRLTSLTLWNLPKFTKFFSGRRITELPAAFLIEQIFPNLEKLSVQGKSISILWEFPGDFTWKMRHLDINLDDSMVISSLDFLQRFRSIKKLNIGGRKDCQFTDKEESSTICNLNVCSDLKHILKEESNMDHLIHLEVQERENLVNLLLPSLTSFRNLTTLVVSSCHVLTNIVTASTAKSMGQLREMQIMECNMITEILLADEGDDAKDNEIVFGKLENLHLECLNRLTSFCSVSCTLKFPSLEELLVIKCFQMKSFSGGNLSTPKLQQVMHEIYQPPLKCRNGDLNSAIQQLYEEKQMTCSDNNEVDTKDEDEEDVICSSNVYKGCRLIMIGAKEDIPSSSNNVQMMSSDNDEVNTEDEGEEGVIGSSNMETQSLKEDSG